MKWIVVLMACFVVNIINVEGACQLAPSIDYDPEKVSGLWYIPYAVPDIYQKFVDIGIIYQLQDNSYDTTVMATPTEEKNEQLYKGTLYRNNNKTLTFQSSALLLGQFNGEYRFASTDYNRYFILQACVPGVYDGETTLVLFRKQCADKESQNAATMAIKQLGLDVSAFATDPTLKCPQ